MKGKQLIFLLFFLILATGMAVPASGAVKLPRLVGNGMVLQRDIPLRIWGWADKNEQVTVQFQGRILRTKADSHGNWAVMLPPTAAGGPFTMKVNELEISDIWLGDVWLCSGQSNMELPIRRVLDVYREEIAKVNNPRIRQFRSFSRNDVMVPQHDYPDGKWLPATPPYIMDFSAVAYFFADDLYRKYQVPIGLIQTAIGGSPAESWLSPDKVKGYLDEWKLLQSQTQKEAPTDWYGEVNRTDPGTGHWSKAGTDVTDWEEISLPGYWSDKGVDLINGSLWFYKEFEVADSLLNREAVLRLGRIIDSDSAFVNGTFVGTISYQYPPRIYNLPAGLLKSGKNSLMVRVFSQGGKGGFVEGKPYKIVVGRQTIDLTGDWKYHIGAKLAPSVSAGSGLQFQPGGLYNGLIAPVVGYKLKGVIWFQGESNTGRAKAYRELFQQLIVDWRDQLHQPELPFLFAQLANLGIPNKQPVESGWAELRDAQRRALQLPHTGMAVTCDIGEWNDIHPLNKKEVGHRLALEAGREAYGDNLTVSAGPLYQSMKMVDGSILLTFSLVGSGLYANSLLDGFQIAGADGQFVWAKAVVMSKNSVKVWSDKITRPKAVRYAWDDNPAGANLMNKEGLPASPFTTEE